MIDFSLPEDIDDLRRRTAAFVRDVVLPYEADPRQDRHGPSEALRADLVEHARRAGLLSPHLGAQWGGLGLDHRGRAVVFEEAGYSPLGPVALAIAAPDEGNGHLLQRVGSPEQQERYLRPLAEGRVRSMFCMTEPEGGAGSDPSMLRTEAREVDDGGVVNGRKWLITGADGAAFAFVMARTFDRTGTDLGATIFLCDADESGIEVVEVLDTLDTNAVGGHSVVELRDLHVRPDDVLGAVGQGFRNAQIRLAPARLTHCMRWLGAARRCHDVAVEYARTRQAFGRPLGEHEGVGFQLADNLLDLHTSRLTIWQCAWVLDQGGDARSESSLAKVHCSEALSRVVDRCVQVLGGMGITSKTVVRRVYEDIRAFRIYDGPSEVHRWALARTILRE